MVRGPTLETRAMAWKIRLFGKRRRFKVATVKEFTPDRLDLDASAEFLAKSDASAYAEAESKYIGGWAFVVSGYKRPFIEHAFRNGKRVSLNTWYTLLMFDSEY